MTNPTLPFLTRWSSLFIVTMNDKKLQQRLCTIKGCGKLLRARGWCCMHWARWKSNGNPNIVQYDKNCNPPKLCTLCKRKHFAKMFCKKHYFSHHKPIQKRALERQKRIRNTPEGRVQMLAQLCVNNAKISGRLIQKPCEVCNMKKSHAHHNNYHRKNWLKIIWLCAKHHIEWHKNNNAIYPKSI